jgi:hypothetical protein
MATFRNRNGKSQARVQIQGHTPLSKTFINKVDAERSEKSMMFRYLTDLGNNCNMFYKKLKTRGRPPSGYTQLDLTDPEQLALAILRTLSKQSLYGLALSLHGISHAYRYKQTQYF